MEYLEAQILNISLLGANHAGAFLGLICVSVCPKKLWIRHWYYPRDFLKYQFECLVGVALFLETRPNVF